MISLKRSFLFVHIPKTGGNSIQEVLREYSEDEVVCAAPHQDGVERFGIRNDRYNLKKHSTLSDYRRELGGPLFNDMFKFCCVRNPWERAVSFYFSPHRGPTSWDRMAFIELVNNLVPAAAFVTLEGVNEPPRPPFDNVDFVLRFERLDEDFRTVCGRIGIPYRPLAVRNKSSREHFSKYYDPELVELVRRRFRDEVEYFGYEPPPFI